MDKTTISEVMSAMGKRSAAKRIKGMSKEQLSAWGKHAVSARWAKERARKAVVGTNVAT